MSHDFSDLKVAGIAADAAACGGYRIRMPIEFLKRGGAQAVVIDSVLNPHWASPFDYIIAQRQYSQEVYRILFGPGKARHTILYELDDNLHKVHPSSSAYSTYKPGSDVLHTVDRFLARTDGLFVSTPELGSQYRDRTKRCFVLPNYIDFGMREWDAPIDRDERLVGKIAIGWAGGVTHVDDVEPVVQAVKRVLDRYPEAVFAVCSAYVLMDYFVGRMGLPEDRVVRLDPVPFDRYPEILKQFDIGIAPLVNTDFNRAKSYLKILEYSAVGVPYVATDIAPYARFHHDTGGFGGFLAATTTDWVDRLSHLVENTAERRSRSEFLCQITREQYSYENNIWRWAQALREARYYKLHEPETERKVIVHEKPSRNDPCPCGSGKKVKKCHPATWG